MRRVGRREEEWWREGCEWGITSPGPLSCDGGAGVVRGSRLNSYIYGCEGRVVVGGERERLLLIC